MTPDQRAAALRAGEQAAEFYAEHPFEAARLQILQVWAKSKTVTEREDAWYELQALDRVVNILRAAGDNAKVAAIEIANEQAAATGQVDVYEHP